MIGSEKEVHHRINELNFDSNSFPKNLKFSSRGEYLSTFELENIKNENVNIKKKKKLIL